MSQLPIRKSNSGSQFIQDIGNIVVQMSVLIKTKWKG